MSAPIDPKIFSGTNGLKVERDAGTVGELDPADVVTTSTGETLAWDDPAYVAAREAFVRHAALLSSGNKSFDGLVCGLEPPRTDARKRRCAAAPAIRASVQTVNDVAAATRAALKAGLSGPQRGSAHRLLAWGEGITLQHYTLLPWNRLEPGRNALQHLRTAMRDDPNDPTAFSNYAMALLGIRASTLRGLAETNLPVQTTPELQRLARRLARFDDDLKAQTLLLMTLDDLRREHALPPELASLGNGLRERVQRLRTRNPVEAEDVDDTLQEMRDRMLAAAKQ
ncbi:MAG: hypothetical protein ACAI38_16265 [Myxococcota bacterium]|nr:hypothetical protein [Myxococcota bacterium]